MSFLTKPVPSPRGLLELQVSLRPRGRLLARHVSSPVDARNRTVPCLQLLRFLQRNTVIVIGSVAGILATTVLLLLMLTILNRKKQAL